MQLPLLEEIVIILGLSVLIILLFQRLRIPSIIGLLVTGIIAGPHGLSLISATHEVELLSEIGVVFLMFVIGIEFSLKGLSSIRKTVLWGGLIQVGGTILLTMVFSKFLHLTTNESVFMGFLLSLSSTAIVIKMLQERGEITTPHGRVAVGILIFQDIIVVPMMLVTPILAGVSEDPLNSILLLAGKVIVVISLVILLARYFVPIILIQVVKTKSKDLFVLTVVVMCFATAWLTSSVGLSLALGAFFAGLIISESEYSHQATANILPFREIFISFFFVSIGMLLNVEFFFEHFVLIHLLAFAVMFLKAFIAGIAALALRYPQRTVFLVALSLFQVGEFSFVLSTTGLKYDLISDEVYQYFLAITIISMGATPFVIKYANQIAGFLIRAPLPKVVRTRLAALQSARAQHEGQQSIELQDHIIIIGYGINGKNVARAARHANIPYIIIELDPDTIREARKNQEPIIFGDAVNETILQHAEIHEARVVVIAISDPSATKKIVNSIRLFTETAYLVVRTRYIKEIEENLKLGADEVIPEEFETSIEIFTRVLKRYLVPADEIEAFINDIRSSNYDLLRESAKLADNRSDISMHIPEMEIAALHVQCERSKVVEKPIRDSGLRSNYGVTVLAIKRGKMYIQEITPETNIQQDDILYVFGAPTNIARLNKYLKM